MSLTPTKGLIDALNGDAAVQAAVPGQVWFLTADQDARGVFTVVRLFDGEADVECQGSQRRTLAAMYEVVTYAEVKDVSALRVSSEVVHAAVLALRRGDVFDGWVLRRAPQQRRVVERQAIQDGAVRWHGRGAVYELNFSEE